jgi:hypothetical protein
MPFAEQDVPDLAEHSEGDDTSRSCRREQLDLPAQRGRVDLAVSAERRGEDPPDAVVEGERIRRA